MLPACRTEGGMFAIPQFALDPLDVEGFMDELHGFHTAFRDCFARSELRDHFFHYMVGQFSELDRKSIEPMALRVQTSSRICLPQCGVKPTVGIAVSLWIPTFSLPRVEGLIRPLRCIVAHRTHVDGVPVESVQETTIHGWTISPRHSLGLS
jgi:hypothetical protein